MPVIPYSGGTSLEGHFVGVRNSPYEVPRHQSPNTRIRSISAVEGWGHMCRHVRNGQDYRNSRYVASLQSVFFPIDRMISAFQKRTRTLSVSQA